VYSIVKRSIPGSFKTIYWQKYLRIKFSRKNRLGKGIVFAKDLIMGKNCRIGEDVKIGRSVKINDDVSIGGNAFIENIEVGQESVIEGNVICTGYGQGRIIIGKNSYIGINNILDWSDRITIGDFVHISGPSTGLWTHSSAPMCYHGIPLKQKDVKYRPTHPILIEDHVYIGGNCTIYPGVKIGHHSIVAPNSAVTKDVDSHTMVGGVPAKMIKYLTGSLK
jgi:acetyltransferase-like isoleucine patch superfamily enzyme